MGQARPPNEPAAAESPRQVRWVKFPISPTVGSGDDGPRAVSTTVASESFSAPLDNYFSQLSMREALGVSSLSQ